MSGAMVPLRNLIAEKVPTVDPSKFPDEEFELWSIPAFDAGQPEVILGAEIGSNKQVVEPGDVLLSKIVPHIRRAWVVSINSDLRKIASGEWIVFRGNRFDPNFLRHILVSNDFHSLFMLTVAGVGGSLLRARPQAVKSLSIFLPPLHEQKRIAAILDQAHDVRRRASQAEERFSGLGAALFWDTFVRDGLEDWPTVTVDSLVDRSRGGIRTGPFGSQLLHAEFVDSGISVLGIDNAVSNEFRWSGRRFITPEKYSGLKRYKVYPGDVLITIMGTCGRCAIVPPDVGEAINTKHLCCITLDGDRCVPEYLYYYFLNHPEATRHLARQSKGAIMQGLNMGIIKDLPVVLPPLAIQAKFAQRIHEVKAELVNITAAKSSADQLFTSLQQRAFRGEL